MHLKLLEASDKLIPCILYLRRHGHQEPLRSAGVIESRVLGLLYAVSSSWTNCLGQRLPSRPATVRQSKTACRVVPRWEVTLVKVKGEAQLVRTQQRQVECFLMLARRKPLGNAARCQRQASVRSSKLHIPCSSPAADSHRKHRQSHRKSSTRLPWLPKEQHFAFSAGRARHNVEASPSLACLPQRCHPRAASRCPTSPRSQFVLPRPPPHRVADRLGRRLANM